jgi:hypothetical protein
MTILGLLLAERCWQCSEVVGMLSSLMLRLLQRQLFSMLLLKLPMRLSCLMLRLLQRQLLNLSLWPLLPLLLKLLPLLKLSL